MFEGAGGIAELPGDRATRLQISMLYTRYRLAAGLVKDGDVLEVACGPGVGLEYLAKQAKHVTGGDADDRLLRMGREHVGDHIQLTSFDAHALPFPPSSFDVVILFEAIYYLHEVERFIDETRRVLKSSGTLLICSANRERHGFVSGEQTVAYFSAFELRQLLTGHGFSVEVFAAFPVVPVFQRNSRGAARWFANIIRLSPETKAVVKRLLFGRPPSFPAEVTERMADAAELFLIDENSPVTDFQVLYAIGHVR